MCMESAFRAKVAQYEREGVPFMGYLHRGGFAVVRTDRVAVDQYSCTVENPTGVRRTYEHVTRQTLDRLRAGGKVVEVVERKPQCSRFRRFGAWRKQVGLLRRQGRLIETVESDGSNVYYAREAGWESIGGGQDHGN